MKTNRKNDYVVKTVYRSFVLVSVLSALTATAGMLIDNIIVGQFLGAEALGAMGVISPISLIFSAFSNICSGGGTAKAAQAIGKGDREAVCNIFTITIIFVFVGGGILTVVGLLFAPQIALMLGAQGALHELATDYLRGFFLSAIPTILMTALMGFIKIDGSPNLPMASILTMTSGNIILDIFMVQVLHMGMFGMALATTLSYCLAVGVGCLHFCKKCNTLKLIKPKNFAKEFTAVIITGSPTAVSRICDTIKVMVLNNMLVTVVGVAAVTALNVRSQVNNIVGALIIGVGQAIIPIAGMFYGEEDPTALRDTMKSTLKMGIIGSVAGALVLCVFPELFPRLLGIEDAATMKMAVEGIILFAVSMPFVAVNTIFKNFYQSTEKPGIATVVCVLQSLVFTTLAAVVLIKPFGSMGVWVAFLIGEILTLLVIIVWVAWKKKKLPMTLEEYMMLPESLGGDEANRLDLSVGNDMKEVMEISSGIYKFGRGKEIDEHVLNQMSLCIEEMAGNIVQHAFKSGEKRWLDMVVVNKKDTILIQMRDNGKLFDPVNYYKEQIQENPEEHIGIRMIQSIAQRFEYRRSIGLNNLVIELKK